MHLGLVDIIFLIAASLISISYFFTDILLLRLLSIIGAVGYIIGGFLAGIQQPGMTTIIVFSLINSSINLIQSIRIIFDRIPILLPNELKDIYTKVFDKMTPNEFLKIYRLCKTKTAQRGEHITIQNEPVKSLILLKDGLADIIENGYLITSLDSGFFVGEMSFFTGHMANATVTIESDTVNYLVWARDKLDKLKIREPQLYEKLEHAISVNLIKKIERQTHLSSGLPSSSS